VKIAILGCGYVADFYMVTVANHKQLEIVGVYDIDPARLTQFCNYYSVTPYESFDALLADDSVEMVWNLTNPRAHFETSSACLKANKHVYSEKPLAMDSKAARELVDLAKDQGMRIACAPCNSLSETAQTLWKAISEDVVGPIRLVTATFDEGMIHRQNPQNWRSVSGAPWPAKDEFEVGCTYEHAAYVLSWMAAYFGPARKIYAYAATLVDDKGIAVDSMAPDYSVANIEYDNNVMVRFTTSIITPLDKSITIYGEKGILHTKNVRIDASPVYIKKIPGNCYVNAGVKRLGFLRLKLESLLRLPFSISGLKIERKIPFARKPTIKHSIRKNKPVDFCKGPIELASAINENRACRLSPELGIQMTELIETLQYPERFDRPRVLTSDFEPIEPLPWDA